VGVQWEAAEYTPVELVVVAHREGIVVVEVGMRKAAVGKQLVPVVALEHFG